MNASQLTVDERMTATEELLKQIADRFKEGLATPDLLEALQSLWGDVPNGTTLTPDQQTRLSDLMQKLNETVSVGENWMIEASAVLSHMARGRKMVTAYQS